MPLLLLLQIHYPMLHSFESPDHVVMLGAYKAAVMIIDNVINTPDSIIMPPITVLFINKLLPLKIAIMLIKL